MRTKPKTRRSDKAESMNILQNEAMSDTKTSKNYFSALVKATENPIEPREPECILHTMFLGTVSLDS